MISDNALTGWLCFFRLQVSNDAGPTMIPEAVEEALVARGWIESEQEPDWQGNHASHITDAGTAVSDLAAAEWGIDSIPRARR